MTYTPKVYAAIAEVQADVSALGLAKTERNEGQKYDFRGIDGLLNLLSPILVKRSLFIVPTVVDHAITHTGKTVHVIIEVEYAITHVDDQSAVIVRTFGEGLDYSDKAMYKALTGAFKYMAYPIFCIPLKGMIDAEGDNPKHEEEPPKAKPQTTPPKDTRSKADIAKQAETIAKLQDDIEAFGNNGVAAVLEICSGKPYNGLEPKSMTREMALGLHRDLMTLKDQLTAKEKK